MRARQANWAETEWVAIREGLERKGFNGDNLTVVMHRFGKDGAAPVHSHHHEQIFLILEGEAEITVDGTVLREGPQGLVHVPSNLPHGIRATGGKPLIVLEIFTPSRPDLTGPLEAAAGTRTP